MPISGVITHRDDHRAAARELAVRLGRRPTGEEFAVERKRVAAQRRRDIAAARASTGVARVATAAARPSEPTSYAKAILRALQGRQVYAGTAPTAQVARRRATARVTRTLRRFSRSR